LCPLLAPQARRAEEAPACAGDKLRVSLATLFDRKSVEIQNWLTFLNNDKIPKVIFQATDNYKSASRFSLVIISKNTPISS
jgi:hypothetical protein